MKYHKELITGNRILLGLAMLIPGLLKIFVMGPDAIIEMLAGLGFPAATAFAWTLIIAEIASGAFMLINKNIKEAVIAPALILVIAAFTAHLGNYPNMLVHIALASNYLLLRYN
jgi:uncharacterized membrane protein YphA (DoxX/SURF4 family)